MAKCKIKPDTANFHFYNINPENENTGDCVIRAIAAFLKMSWKETYLELAHWGIDHGYMLNNRECFEGYLREKGYQRMPMPVKGNRKRYTIVEFCNKIALPNYNYIISTYHHLTYIGPDQKIWDSWNCGKRSVGVYWVRKIECLK